ncbi:hypothetical protein BOQ54_18770 (plasmid) [Chelatococcus daeguensis]|uniref:Uncharacterized protein n=2 Tax=Chelatococcus daeguensis TaxID=444444 RepID=A0AAC9JY27_9HYPH|nr:hypothetical protein BOQ54_18770 [Chelatococcus daeguensis]
MPGRLPSVTTYAVTEATGALVPMASDEGMAVASAAILSDETLRERLAANAARDAIHRFSLTRQIAETVDWYCEIRERFSQLQDS